MTDIPPDPSTTLKDRDPKLIVALDFDAKETCLALVRQLDPGQCRLKIGKEMFTHFGPDLVETIQGMGFDVFLDLKFHDIPNTVAKAVNAAASIGVWMVNVHASGGLRMMEAAKNALASFAEPPKLIAVTVLTSMSAEDLVGTGMLGEPAECVKRLALLTAQAELDGVVSSAQEAAAIKQACGAEFLTVTPGIRPRGAALNDQRRVVLPAEAIRGGSDYLVIGRPITQASDPLAVLQDLSQEVAAELRL